MKIRLFLVSRVLGTLRFSRCYCRKLLEAVRSFPAKGILWMKNLFQSASNPEEKAFYSTLCSISSTILAIFMAFIIGYFIYTIQKQDELSIHIQSELQNLDTMFHRFSSLREYSTRDWLPTSNHILIMQKETWDGSASNLLDDEVRLIEEEFNRVMTKHQGLFPTSAVFNQVQSHVHGLFQKIYLELPCPPGIVRKEGSLTYFEKFVRDDFPACEIEFAEWANKFQKFRAEVINVYSNLRPTFGIMQEVREKDIDRTIGRLGTPQNLKDLIKIDIDNISLGTKTYIEYLKNQSEYYDAFFLSLNSLGNKVSEITRYVDYYRNYKRNRPSLFTLSSLCMTLAAVFGIIMPLVKIHNLRSQWILIIGFVVFTLLSLLLFVNSLTPVTL